MYIMNRFSKEELRDLGISILVYTVAFSIYSVRDGYLGNLPLYFVVLTSFLVAIFAFLVHEMAHRYLANRYGGAAAFKMWPPGALIALLSSLFGVIFAAVGAVYINGVYDREKLGKVSLAGPATNMAIGIVFYAVYIFSPFRTLAEISIFIATLNFFMGFFNLLPIPPFDGFKVWQWSKDVYIVSIAISLLLLVFSYFT